MQQPYRATVNELVENGKALTSSAILASPQKCELLEYLFMTFGDELQANHRQVLGGVMGFGCPQQSQTELADTLGLSRARIGAICSQAIKNLTTLAQAKGVTAQPGDKARSADLAVFQGEGIAKTVSWANLSDEDLRREAVRAANSRDAEALWDLTEAFLTLYSAKRSKVSRHTLRTYRRGVLDLIVHWQDENLLNPSRDAGAKYLLQLEATPYTYKNGSPQYYKPETLNSRLAAARTLYRALRWAKATATDPFGNVKPVHDPVPPEEKRPAYSENDVLRLVETANPVDRAFVLLCAHGGLRAEEVTTIRWHQIDLERAGMTVLGKGNKQQWVGFSDDLAAALSALYEGQSSRLEVLPFGPERARERLASLCQQAGVDYKGIHSLRHHAGTRMWALHRSLDAPADHLRHANVQTTRRYAKKTREQRREMARSLSLKPDSSKDAVSLETLAERLADLDDLERKRLLDLLNNP